MLLDGLALNCIGEGKAPAAEPDDAAGADAEPVPENDAKVCCCCKNK